MKPIQYFTDEYLAHCKTLSQTQIARFLEEFRCLHTVPYRSKLISIKIPENLLSTFRTKCELEGIKYQTKINELMMDWISPNTGN